MHGSIVRTVIVGVTAAGLAAGVCRIGRGQDSGPARTTAARYAAAAVIDPTAELTADQVVFLRQVAARTWDFLSGPDLDPATHLPLVSVRTYLSAIVAARDLGVASPGQAEAAAAAALGGIETLPRNEGLLVDRCDTGSTTAPGGRDPDGYVSTVDNGWLAQGLLVAERAFPTGRHAVAGALRPEARRALQRV
jgi:hypothetical protein